MSEFEEFINSAAATPSTQPDRPPMPGMFEQTEFVQEGEGVFTLVMGAGDNDDEFLLADPEDVVSLRGWA